MLSKYPTSSQVQLHDWYAKYFPGLFFLLFFSLLPIYGWSGFWGLGLGFWGWDCQLMGLWACGVGPSLFFGVGAFYINIEESSWEPYSIGMAQVML